MFSLLNKLLILLVRSYRCCVSPLLVALFPMLGCRFQPTCSVYALEALQRHGPFRGTWLALQRLARCHPWGGCGPDPVPPPRPDGRLAPATPTPTAAASPALGCSATAQGGHECHQHSASLATSLP